MCTPRSWRPQASKFTKPVLKVRGATIRLSFTSGGGVTGGGDTGTGTGGTDPRFDYCYQV